MPDMNTPNTDPHIMAYARAVAAAEEKSVTTAAALGAAIERHSLAARRLAALREQRAAIVARRAAGDTRPTDGADLALLDADTEGLAGIVAELSAAVDAARPAAEDANRILSNARASLAHAEGEAAERALVEHADALLGRLVETAARIEATRTALGRPRPSWAPRRDAMEMFRRLQVLAGVHF